MNIPIEYDFMLANKGLDLSDLGVSNFALLRTDALVAVSILQVALIPVLGGDVYLKNGGRIETAYANWYVEPRDGESAGSFAERSCIETLAYINAYPASDALFALVIDR